MEFIVRTGFQSSLWAESMRFRGRWVGGCHRPFEDWPGQAQGTGQCGYEVGGRAHAEQHRPGRKSRSSHKEENRNEETQGQTTGGGKGWTLGQCKAVKGPGRQGWGEQGRARPSPEDVEADVALEVNVGMIDHRLTLHLGGVMRVTLAHLAPGKEGRWTGAQQCLAGPQPLPPLPREPPLPT